MCRLAGQISEDCKNSRWRKLLGLPIKSKENVFLFALFRPTGLINMSFPIFRFNAAGINGSQNINRSTRFCRESTFCISSFCVDFPVRFEVLSTHTSLLQIVFCSVHTDCVLKCYPIVTSLDDSNIIFDCHDNH